MRSQYAAVLLAAPLVFLPRGVGAEIVIHDDFDDGVLDPAWEVILEDANGWTYSESGTELVVTEIDAAIVNHTSGGPWAIVRLGRSCPALSDLHVDFDFSWDCAGTDAAMQNVVISLYDGSGQVVIRAGFEDDWIGDTGCQWTQIGANWQCSSDLPHFGAASLDIDRTGDQVDILWDDGLVMSDTLTASIEKIEIVFSHNAYDGPPTNSVFGTESVDLVNIEGTPTSIEEGSWGKAKARFR